MSQQATGILRQSYDDFRRGNFVAVFRMFHLTIKVYRFEHLLWGGRYEGLEEAGRSGDNLATWEKTPQETLTRVLT